MKTPPSLRAARLLLVAAAAASIGCVAVILSRASGVSPFLAFFLVAAGLFIAATRELEQDPHGGRLLAGAGALTLAGIGVLAGFGAGDMTFPAAGLGVLAAWAALLHPPRRRVAMAFGAYVAIGAVATAPRLILALSYPWTLATLFLWPWTLLIAGPAAVFAMIYGSFGIAVALVAAYASRRSGRPPWTPPAFRWRDIPVATSVGAVSVALFVGLSYARQNTSARFEFGVVPLAVLFGAGWLAAVGVSALRASPAIGVVATAIGCGILIFTFLAEPTVACVRGGGSTGPGPWWLAWRGGALSSEGRVAPDGSSSGTISRADGTLMTYRCDGERVVEFSISP